MSFAPTELPNIQTLFDVALQHHQGGRLTEAEVLYRRILTVDSRHADSLHLLGVIAHQGGQHAVAVELIANAIDINEAVAAYHSNRGNALFDLTRFDEALASYDAALRIDPDYADAHSNRGNVLRELGRLNEALASYDAALRITPGYAKAHSNRGAVLKDLGRLDEALASFDAAVRIKPDYAKAHANRGTVLKDLGRLDEALASYDAALRIRPDYAEALSDRAITLYDLGRLDDAIASLNTALRIKPAYSEALYNRGVALGKRGSHGDAIASYNAALRISPDHALARWGITLAQIPAVYASGSDPAVCRAAFAAELAALDTWFTPARMDAGAKAVGTQTPFYLAYQEDNNRTLLSQHGALCSRLMEHWQKSRGDAPSPRAMVKAAAKIQVGIVSKHVHEHPVWRTIMRGWLQHIDRDRFDLNVFSLGRFRDGETAFARSRAATFVEGPQNLAAWRESILERRLDILVYPEIGMDQTTMQLASLRLAPVQVSTWGHPETTGLPNIDYYLSAEGLEPAAGARNYTETLVLLPGLGCCYDAPPVQPAELALSALGLDGCAPLLLCPGTPFKYAPAYDWVFPEIARTLIKEGLSGCTFVFFTFEAATLSDVMRRRLAAAFDAAGLSFEAHVVFIPWQPRNSFYSLMRRAEVYLDTIGFSGFNTAMQAVECRLPVVTTDGRFLRGRLAAGIMRQLGLSELVCASPEAYVALAAKLAVDRSYRDSIVQRMEAGHSVLFGDMAPIRAMEEFLTQAARRTA